MKRHPSPLTASNIINHILTPSWIINVGNKQNYELVGMVISFFTLDESRTNSWSNPYLISLVCGLVISKPYSSRSPKTTNNTWNRMNLENNQNDELVGMRVKFVTPGYRRTNSWSNLSYTRLMCDFFYQNLPQPRKSTTTNNRQ